MKLRFAVDQAACFRKGIDCPKSIITIEVNPADISEKDRNLIADRLVGIDVAQLSENGVTMVHPNESRSPRHIVAQTPDWDGLIAAVKIEHQSLLETLKKLPHGSKLEAN